MIEFCFYIFRMSEELKDTEELSSLRIKIHIYRVSVSMARDGLVVRGVLGKQWKK